MGWNGSGRKDEPVRVVRPKRTKSPFVSVMIPLSLLVVVGVIGVWLMTGNEESSLPKDTATVEKHNKKPSQTAGRPVARGRNSVTSAPPIAVGRVEPHEVAETDTTTPTNKLSPEAQAQFEKFRREPIRGAAAQLLAMVSPPKKGVLMPPAPIGPAPKPGAPDKLDEMGEKLLKERGEVEEWDTELSIKIKEDFEALREEWREAHDGGMSFRAFLESKMSRMEGDHEHLKMAKQLDREVYEDQTVTDEEYQNTHKKINKLLEVQGFDQLKTPNQEAEEESSEEAAESAQAPAEQK